jgi:KDO2-lipid IV(A) lauroyltransferase
MHFHVVSTSFIIDGNRISWSWSVRQYYLLKTFETTLAYLPKRFSYLLACLLGAITFGAIPSLRHTINGNISRVLRPEDYNDKLNKTVRGVLTNTFKNYIDLVSLPHQSHDKITSMINVTGRHHLDKAIQKGKGAILCTAHLGCFDAAFQAFSAYPTQMTVVVEPINPPLLLNYVTAMRERFGVKILHAKSGALKQIFKLLRKGEMLLFALDRDITGARVQSSFFGRKTSMPAEAVKIAMRTGAAIVPVFNSRRSDGNYNIYVEPEIEFARNGNGSLEHNMAQIASVMEKYIRCFPEQWVVLEPIWDN